VAPDELAFGEILERAAELATRLLECGDQRVAADAEPITNQDVERALSDWP